MTFMCFEIEKRLECLLCTPIIVRPLPTSKTQKFKILRTVLIQISFTQCHIQIIVFIKDFNENVN